MNKTQIKKAMASTNLAAEAAAKKPHKEWHQIVPKPYHWFSKIFSEDTSKQLPSSQVWDHAIELKPEAPATFDCKVYPITKQEQEALDEFLKEHHAKGYIEQSKSPYVSPFFFVKKKDGKLCPVQDYRQLNHWTIPNNYPLPLIKDLIPRLAGKKIFTKFDIQTGY